MKKLVAAVLAVAAVAALGCSAEAKEWKKIRIASEGAYPPYNAIDSSGKLVGFEIDLANDLCRRMKAQCEIVAQDWDGMIPALNAGKYDAIMADMSITDERKQAINFAGPYATDKTMFAALKGSPLLAYQPPAETIDLSKNDANAKKAVADLDTLLKGKVVGAQVSTIQQKMLQELIPDATAQTYDKADNMGLDLTSGRIDALLADRSAIDGLRKEESGKDITLFGPGFIGGVLGVGAGVGLRKSDADLKAMFDKAIAEATRDGTVRKLSEQWFGYDLSIPSS